MPKCGTVLWLEFVIDYIWLFLFQPHGKRRLSGISMLTPELKVAMKYEPPVASSSTKASKATQITGGDLHVKVISAQYLSTKKSGMYDPYVKW